MPKLPRITAGEAERMLLQAGYVLLRSKGSHRVYVRDGQRVVVPYHSGRILHPKIIRQVIDAIEAARGD